MVLAGKGNEGENFRNRNVSNLDPSNWSHRAHKGKNLHTSDSVPFM